MTRTPPRAPDVLRKALEHERLDLHVAIPGRVRSYDIETQRAEIALCLRRVVPAREDETEDETEELPILPAVPVLYFRTGSFAIHAPLEADDHVLVVFTDSDLSQFWATGEDASDPGSAVRNGLSGCYAIPGAFWSGTPNPDANGRPRIGKIGGPRIEWKAPMDNPSGTQIQAGGEDALALASPTDTQLANIAADLAALVTLLAGNTGAPITFNPTHTTISRAANPIETSILTGA